jgi:hypothetical protein
MQTGQVFYALVVRQVGTDVHPSGIPGAIAHRAQGRIQPAKRFFALLTTASQARHAPLGRVDQQKLERSMKSFQKRLNSGHFPLCICTALAYLCR